MKTASLLICFIIITIVVGIVVNQCQIIIAVAATNRQRTPLSIHITHKQTDRHIRGNSERR